MYMCLHSLLIWVQVHPFQPARTLYWQGRFCGLVWDFSCEEPVRKLTATSCHAFANHFTSMPGLLSIERLPNPSFVVDRPPKQSGSHKAYPGEDGIYTYPSCKCIYHTISLNMQYSMPQCCPQCLLESSSSGMSQHYKTCNIYWQFMDASLRVAQYAELTNSIARRTASVTPHELSVLPCTYILSPCVSLDRSYWTMIALLDLHVI